MNQKKWKLFLSVSPLVFFLDQLSKYWVLKKIDFDDRITLVEGILDLVHLRNPGAAFGFLSTLASPAREIFFGIVSVLALVLLIYFVRQTTHRKSLIAFFLILGGAFGNIVDRIIHGNVVDFILFHYYDKVIHFNFLGQSHSVTLIWPAFNVADAAISLGVFYIFFTQLFFKVNEVEK